MIGSLSVETQLAIAKDMILNQWLDLAELSTVLQELKSTSPNFPNLKVFVTDLTLTNQSSVRKTRRSPCSKYDAEKISQLMVRFLVDHGPTKASVFKEAFQAVCKTTNVSYDYSSFINRMRKDKEILCIGSKRNAIYSLPQQGE